MAKTVKPDVISQDSQVKTNAKYDTQWQLEKFSHLDRCKFLRKTAALADCVLLVGPTREIFECHRIILAMSSSVLKSQLYNKNGVSHEAPILSTITPDAFRSVLDYIYTDECNLGDAEHAVAVLHAARILLIPSLISRCLEHVWHLVSPETVWKVYSHLVGVLEEPQLGERCIQIIQENTLQLIKEEKLENLDIFHLISVLQQDTLSINSEQDLIAASFEWATKRETRAKYISVSCRAQRNELGFALQHLRFLTLTPEEFVSGPAKSNILTDTEKLAVLMNLIIPGSYVLPTSLCTIKTKRNIPIVKTQTELNYLRKFQRIMTKRQNFKIDSPTETISFYLKSNAIIWIQGFQISTQIRGLKPLTTDTKNNSEVNTGKYLENLSISLERFDVENTSETITEVEVKGELDYKSVIDVKFDTPVLAKPGRELTARIKFKTRGVYSSILGPRTVSNGSNTITLRTESFEPHFDSIIEAIYYIY